ncbi:Envelope glycoprotein B [Folsomia candida]|uniref:Envelope glycoprotein B n=1 Tax=Folsomia candida TaxID=158441 RepID=A0A226F431_FOLCA|nr:Envelope glycoprotein B [Folsomia candida]
MVFKDKAPNGQPLKAIADGHFWTNNEHTVPDYSWPKTTEVLTVNYHYTAMKISINNKDDTIITMTKVTDSCKANQGHCTTSEGILIWIPSQVDYCRLAEGETTKCLMTDTRISCPGVNLAISNPYSTRVCKRTVGYSDQGLLFTPTEKGQVEFLTVVSETLKRAVRGTERLKRSEMPELQEPKFKSSEQINGELQYLYDVLRDDVTYALQTIHRDTCRSQQLDLEMLRAMAETGSTSITVRALTRDGRYRSTLRGNLLSVTKCVEIWEYMFLRQTNCTLEYPVVYMYQHVQSQGWLQGLSHEILDKPTFSACPPPLWLFDMGSQVIQLSNHSLPASNIPYLPSPRETDSQYIIRDLAFDQAGVYSVSDISGESTLINLMQQLQQKTRIDEMIRLKQNGQSFNSEQLRLARLL